MSLEDLYKQHEPRKEIWISELVFCPMKAYYSAVSPRKPKHSVFSLAGILIHERLQEELKDLYECEKRVEIPLDSEWKLVGKLDFYDPLDGCVIEVKSSNSSVLKQEWLEQANLYAYLAGATQFEIWVVKIEDGSKERFVFEVDREKAERLIEVAKRVIKGEKITNKTKCKFCDYADDCERHLYLNI